MEVTDIDHLFVTKIMQQQDREIQITEEFYRYEFKFNGSTHRIPSDLAISELIRFPKLDWQFACRILICHLTSKDEISKHGNLMQILYENSKIGDSDTLWKEIVKEVGSDYDPKLYAFFSLHQYRQKLIQEYDRESQTILRETSDRVISRLIEENTNNLLNPTPYIDILRKFCDEAGVNYHELQYFLTLFAYCSLILPHPMNFIRNINHDPFLLSFFTGEIKKYEEGFLIEEIPLTIHRDDKIGEYQKRRNEAEKRVHILFSDLHDPRKKELFGLTNLIKEKYPDFHRHKFNHESDMLTTHNRERRQSNSEKSKVLCRCEFCYRFRVELRSGNGDYAWNCDRGECKKLYESWKRHLSRKGIGLNDIRKLGF